MTAFDIWEIGSIKDKGGWESAFRACALPGAEFLLWRRRNEGIMLCGICKEKEATVFYTEIINGAKKEQYLCGECAAKSTGLHLKSPFGEGEFSLGTLLAGLFEGTVSKEESGDVEDVGAIVQGGEISCPDYISFPIKMECTHHELKDEEKHEYEDIKEVETLNSMIPIWKKPKNEVKEEDYHHFYTDTYHDYDWTLRNFYT